MLFLWLDTLVVTRSLLSLTVVGLRLHLCFYTSEPALEIRTSHSLIELSELLPIPIRDTVPDISLQSFQHDKSPLSTFVVSWWSCEFRNSSVHPRRIPSTWLGLKHAGHIAGATTTRGIDDYV